MSFRYPLDTLKQTQGWCENAAYYKQYGQQGKSNKYLSYLDFANPIVMPVLGALSLGILKVLCILPSTKAMHIKKSTLSFILLRLNTHTPDCLSISRSLPSCAYVSIMYKLLSLYYPRSI